MIPWLAPVAVAGSPASAPPLPSCAVDPRPIVLPEAAGSLLFHPRTGEIVVADPGGMTVRDPVGLDVRARWAPAETGWYDVRLGPQGTTIEVESGLGPTLTVDVAGGEPRLGGTSWKSSPLLQHGGRGPIVDGVEYLGRIAVVDGELHSFDPVAVPRQLGPAVYRLEPGVVLHAAAVDSDRHRLAYATATELVVVNLDAGAVLARSPLVPSADAAGLVDGRLFTVSEGVLSLWRPDGTTAWTSPDPWTSAVAREGKLLAVRPTGRLATIDLAMGRVRDGRCLRADCDAPPDLPPSPPASDERLDVWRAAVHAWEIGRNKQPSAGTFALIPAGPWVVAAELSSAWRSFGVTATRRVVVIDRKGRLVADQALGAMAPGLPRAVGAAVAIGDRAFSLPDLEPVPSAAPPDGSVEAVVSDADGYDRVVLGTWSHGEHVPNAGLPWRWVPELRRHTVAVTVGDRVVLYSLPDGPSQPSRGAVEAWCVPDPSTDGGAAQPGVIADVPPAPKASSDAAHVGDGLREPEGASASGYPGRMSAGTPIRRVEHHVAPMGAGPEVWARIDRPGDLDRRLVELAAAGHPVRLVLPYEPQPSEVVPEGVGWSLETGRGPDGGPVWIAWRDTALWTGWLDALPSELLEPGPPLPKTVDPGIVADWVTDPGSLDPPSEPGEEAEFHAERVLRVALEAGHLDVARAAAVGLDSPEGSALRLLGSRLPSVEWTTPLPDGWCAIVIEPSDARDVLLDVPSSVCAAVVVSDPGWLAALPRAVVAATVGVPPLGWDSDLVLLVDPGRTIRWVGDLHGLPRAVKALVPGSGVP